MGHMEAHGGEMEETWDIKGGGGYGGHGQTGDG